MNRVNKQIWDYLNYHYVEKYPPMAGDDFFGD